MIYERDTSFASGPRFTYTADETSGRLLEVTLSTRDNDDADEAAASLQPTGVSMWVYAGARLNWDLHVW